MRDSNPFVFWKDVLGFAVKPMRFWEAIAGPVAGAVVSNLLMDDNGAEAANNAQADLARANAEIAKDQYGFWKSNYKPLEESLVAEAPTWGSEAEQEKYAGLAGDQVSRSFGDARSALERNLAQYGFNPSQGRFADAFMKLNLAQAGADASGRNAGRLQSKELGLQKRMNLAGMGRGLPSTAANMNNSAASIFGNVANGANVMSQNQAAGIAPIVNAVSNATTDFVKNRGWENWSAPGRTGTNFNYDVSPSGANGNWSGTELVPYKKGGKVRSGRMALERRAAGGVITGPGTGTSDSVMGVVDGEPAAKLSRGEQVMNVEAVDILGREFLDAANKIGLIKRYERENRG